MATATGPAALIRHAHLHHARGETEPLSIAYTATLHALGFSTFSHCGFEHLFLSMLDKDTSHIRMALLRRPT
jgi:hypothetical protein